MFLLGGDVTDGPMVAPGVVEENEIAQDRVELFKADVVFVFKPVVLEDTKPGLDPGIIGGRLVTCEELLDSLVSEELFCGLLGHLDPVIGKGCRHLRSARRAQEAFVTKGTVPGLFHGVHPGVETEMPAHDLAAEHIDDGKEVDENRTQRNVGQIPTPNLIGTIGFDLRFWLRGSGVPVALFHQLSFLHYPIKA